MSMPNIGLPLYGKPDDWVPADDDDPRETAQIERETQTALEQFESYDDLTERCAGNIPYMMALHALWNKHSEIQRQPMSDAERQRYYEELYSCVEMLLETLEDVARLRVGECIERGESYVYRGDQT